MKHSYYLIAGLLCLFILPFSIHAQEKEAPKHPLEEMGISGLKFRSVGPALTSGRISDFAMHPDNPFVYYVATASGGVWKTNNSGTTFSPIFDSQGSYSIGCVSIDPNNPCLLYTSPSPRDLSTSRMPSSA